MKPVSFWLAGLLALAVTVVSGAIHGRLTNRWGAPPDLESAGKRVESIPGEFGDWKLISQQPFDADTQRMLQCTGSTHRVYRNVKDPARPPVQIALVVGPAGPISVHTPEICYSSRDYARSDERRHLSVHARDGLGEHQLWGVTMAPRDPGRATLRVCYGWTTGGRWQAPEKPRFAFGGEALLYKIQLASEVRPGFSSAESDPCADFLREFLPLLDRTVFAVPASGANLLDPAA